MKAHLLFEDQDFDARAELPPHQDDLIRDLNLTTLLDAMAQGDKFLFDVAKSVLLGSLTDPDQIRYRQEVLADCLSQPEVIRQLYAIAIGAVADQRSIWGFTSSQNPTLILTSALRRLGAFVVRLRELREFADEHAGTFRSQGFSTLFGTLQRDLDDDYLQRINEHLKTLRFRDGELLSAQLGWDNNGINYVLRSSAGDRTSWRARLGIGSRTSYSFTIPPRDEAGGQALTELANRGANLVANAVAQSADHVSSYFTMLRAELGFYIGSLNLHDRLAAKGEATSLPAPSAPDRPARACSALCDASLSLRSEDPVVGNDVETDGKPLVIVTGANSGGKSTFLRSVGLAQLMMQCGMFVTARSYRASVCDGIFTHFMREEDRTMESGRLDKECRRMSSIADELRPHSLVLFNESFAATSEREGSEIGRQVVRALVEADVTVIFVTHQYDFADSFRLNYADSTVFLRAERERNGRRSYKLSVGDPLPTSFGEDVYNRVGRWLGEPDPAAAGRTGGA